MASLPTDGATAPPPLINRPEAKLPALPKGTTPPPPPRPVASPLTPLLPGSRVHKRPLPFPSVRTTARAFGPDFDLDGYRMPPRAPHTVVIKVSASTPFMAAVKRARNALETGPQTTKGLPLTARIAALGVDAAKAGEAVLGPVSDALDEVVLVATGRAIAKALEVGMFLKRNKELVVVVRTRTVAAIDDVVMGGVEEEEGGGEEEVRVRQLSCVEVGIRHRK